MNRMLAGLIQVKDKSNADSPCKQTHVSAENLCTAPPYGRPLHHNAFPVWLIPSVSASAQPIMALFPLVAFMVIVVIVLLGVQVVWFRIGLLGRGLLANFCNVKLRLSSIFRKIKLDFAAFPFCELREGPT